MQYEILRGDCIAQMRAMPDNSVDSIVTDPPYELGFMGKTWDASGIAYSVAMWAEALRVLKPGGHLLAFSGSRTYHRMTCAIEDAGFEVRDQIMWVYGSGFPKSLDVSKAIDKARDDRAEGKAVGAWLKAQREARGLKQKEVAVLWPSATGGLTGCVANWETLGKVPKWDQWLMLKAKIGFGDEMDAEVWRLNGRKGTPGEAWGERGVIGRARGAQSDSTGKFGGWGNDDGTGISSYDLTAPATDAARQWDGWGTALKPAHEPICVARKPLVGTVAANVLAHGTGALNIDGCRVGAESTRRTSNAGTNGDGWGMGKSAHVNGSDAGRWPANLIHDGSDEVRAAFPETTSGKPSGKRNVSSTFMADGGGVDLTGYGDTGSAARFFYCAKASKNDRGPGNTHPTVKPQALMRYLVRLVTPPGGLVLDPFAGSGSTVVAALSEGMRAVGIELLDDHADICETRADTLLYGDLL